MIILGYFFLFLHKKRCGYSLEVPRTTCFFLENWRKLSQNYHQISSTHCKQETRKRVIGKQCRPRSNAAECDV